MKAYRGLFAPFLIGFSLSAAFQFLVWPGLDTTTNLAEADTAYQNTRLAIDRW